MRVLAIGDHPLHDVALSRLLAQRSSAAAVVEVAGRAAMEAAIDGAGFDLVWLDLLKPGAMGFSSLISLRIARPELPVIVASSNDHRGVIRSAWQFGAAGFVTKSASAVQISQAFSAVLAGDHWFRLDNLQGGEADVALALRRAMLTSQQLCVLLRLADGLQNKQIASEISISEHTVKIHVSAILAKLGCSSRTQVMLQVKSPIVESAGMSAGLAEANGE